MPGQTPHASQEGRGEDSRDLKALDTSRHAPKDATGKTKKTKGPVQAPKDYKSELVIIEQSEEEVYY